MSLKLRILRSLTRFFIILVNLTRSLFNEKMLISNSGLMSNLIKKSWTDSTVQVLVQICTLFGFTHVVISILDPFKTVIKIQKKSDKTKRRLKKLKYTNQLGTTLKQLKPLEHIC